MSESRTQVVSVLSVWCVTQTLEPVCMRAFMTDCQVAGLLSLFGMAGTPFFTTAELMARRRRSVVHTATVVLKECRRATCS